MPKTLKPWSVTTSLPGILRPEDLGMDKWVRQCRISAWAPSRAAFARMLIETKVSFRSEASTAKEVADYGGDLNPESAWAARIPKPQGDCTRVYAGALDGDRGPLLAIVNGKVEVE